MSNSYSIFTNKFGYIIFALMLYSSRASGQGVPTKDTLLVKHFHPTLSLKTNTIYWLALTPNVEGEIYFDKRHSVNTEAQFAWWTSNQGDICYQLLSAGSELRYWFVDKKKQHRHYAGLYGSGGIYDIMLRRKQDGFQGGFWSVGLTYGYVKPVNNNFSLEFGIGIGYLNSAYSRYERCADCFQRKSRERTHWLGPTKAKIALVWRIGSKGGRE